ncbi:alpha/beta hydrolase [Algoriphagus aestuariicola]|uniref:Alpha/beta hydrolase n=1 Tax=Algoriphagus aestuariicola TaxID=1852016 RepID=A0ABS3BUB2_9BACT|nr:alpha/beta hydrolase [Algoriphagus aestuariicola]MBN7802826.1 alpha/beta hydrolase [Algoriphagus aestuariicola]
MKYVFLALVLLGSIPSWAQEGVIFGNGAKLHYRIFGTGDPLLLINGGPGMSSEGMADLAQRLAQDNAVIIYDQRGTGLSEVPALDENHINIKKMIEDIEVLREHLEIESWIVLGQSFGGMLAYFYAAKHPKRVKAMIQSHSAGMSDMGLFLSSNPAKNLSKEELDSLLFFEAKIKAGDSSEVNLRNFAEARTSAYLYRDDDEMVNKMARAMLSASSRIKQLVMVDVLSNGLSAENKMKRFRKPVLLLQGEYDIFMEQLILDAHQTLKNSKMLILPDCGHWGWIEQPNLYFGEIEAFLDHVNQNPEYAF